MRSLYGTLGVDRRATRQEIKRAYYQAAHDCHPDKCPNDAAAAQRFSEISLAYTVLNDPTQRKRYDLLGPMAVGLSPAHADLSILGPEGEQLAQAIGSVVGGVMGRLRRRASKRRYDVDVHIDVATALRGGTRQIQLDRAMPCPTCAGAAASPPSPSARPQSSAYLAARCATCRGARTVQQQATYRLRIPADVTHHTLLRMQHAGTMGRDLIVRLCLDSHPLLRLRGADLFIDVPVRPSLAALGGLLDLRLPHKTLALPIAPGTQTGDLIPLSGEGLKAGRGPRRGTLYVTVDIEVPKDMPIEVSQAWRALATAESKAASIYPKAEAFARAMQQ